MPCNARNTAVRGMEEGRIQTILDGAGRTSDRRDKATNSSLGQDHEDSARDSRSRHRGRGNERKSPPARPGRTHPPGYRMSLHKVPRSRAACHEKHSEPTYRERSEERRV